MTATRWWVQLAARWLARVDGVSGQLRLLFLAMTGYGIAMQTLSQYGLGDWALEFIGVSALLLVIYTFYYNEGGVRNQVSRDRQDLSTNYAGPTMRLDDEMIARGVLAAQKGKPLSDQERQAIKTELDDAWYEYRNGLSEDYFNDS